MSALTAQRRSRNLVDQLLISFEHPTKATKVFYKGAMVALDATGYLVPAAGTAGLKVVGLVDTGTSAKVDTTGQSDGDTVLKVQAGIWLLNNSTAGDAIAQADVYGACYVADDNTVAKTDGGVSRPVAGTIVKVGTEGVYVAVGFPMGVPFSSAAGSTAAEQIANSGALSVVKRSTILNVSGTKAYTLADGVAVGQRKTIFCRAAASTPVGVVTPAHPNNFATLTFSTANGGTELEWNGTAWDLVAVSGTVTVA